jgi:hypothetical protein
VVVAALGLGGNVECRIEACAVCEFVVVVEIDWLTGGREVREVRCAAWLGPLSRLEGGLAVFFSFTINFSQDNQVLTRATVSDCVPIYCIAGNN